MSEETQHIDIQIETTLLYADAALSIPLERRFGLHVSGFAFLSYLFYVNSMLFCYFFFRRRDTEPLAVRGLFLLVGLVELVKLVEWGGQIGRIVRLWGYYGDTMVKFR